MTAVTRRRRGLAARAGGEGCGGKEYGAAGGWQGGAAGGEGCGGAAARGGGEGWWRVFACGRPRSPPGVSRGGGGWRVKERGGRARGEGRRGEATGLRCRVWAPERVWTVWRVGWAAEVAEPPVRGPQQRVPPEGRVFYEPLARSGSGRGQSRPLLVERQNSAKRRGFGRAIESRAGSRGSRRPADCVRAGRAPFRRMELTF